MELRCKRCRNLLAKIVDRGDTNIVIEWICRKCKAFNRFEHIILNAVSAMSA